MNNQGEFVNTKFEYKGFSFLISEYFERKGYDMHNFYMVTPLKGGDEFEAQVYYPRSEKVYAYIASNTGGDSYFMAKLKKPKKVNQ